LHVGDAIFPRMQKLLRNLKNLIKKNRTGI